MLRHRETAPPPEPAPMVGSARSVSGWAALTGTVAGLAGLAVADIGAWLLAPAGSPVTAVGERTISWLPASMVNWGKDTLGTADKPILIAIVAVVVVAVAAGAGLLERHRPRTGGLVFALLAALGVTAVIIAPGTTYDVGSIARLAAPTAIGLGAAYGLLVLLRRKLDRWQPVNTAPTPYGMELNRRSFLVWTAAIGVGAGIATVAGRVLSGVQAAVQEARDLIHLPLPAKPAVAVPAGADLGVPGLAPYITANDDFYRIDTALQVPVINPDDWTLTVTGMVEHEIKISFADLLARPMVERLTTLACVSNTVGGDLVGNALWLGAPIRDLIAEARPLPGADMLLSRSHDGWTAGTPLEILTDPDRECLLAVGMNGEPLPVDHGFPVRMIVPGLYGYVSATKWVVELKVTTFAADQGYWTPLGWSALGPIKIASRIDVPRKRQLEAGEITVAGVAWAQHIGIERVQVRVDDGPWDDAALAETVGPDTWRQWSYPWAADKGQHVIEVRAVDAAGLVQTDDVAPPAPDGASGYHSITIEVS